MATDISAPAGAEGPDDERKPSPEVKRPEKAEKAEKAGFFNVYKKGQGYWTRMGTALGAVLIAGLTAYFFYEYVPTWLPAGMDAPTRRNIALGVAAGTFAVLGLLAWWLMNKPDNADFLIATDTEMKKVNWTSRRELIGSTRVVIAFMFLIAFLLFVIDLLFHTIFWAVGVLKTKPFFLN